VIYDLGKYKKGETAHSKDIANALLGYATSLEVPTSVSDQATTKFGDLMKRWKYSVTVPFFQQLIDNLKNHQCSVQSLRILKKMVKEVEYISITTGNSDSDDDILDRVLNSREALNKMLEDEDLIALFVKDLVHYCDFAKKEAKSLKSSDKIEGHIFSGHSTHSDSIKTRLDFLVFLGKESDFKINKSLVNQLWDLLIDNSDFPCDEAAFYKWLIESCEQDEDKAKEIWEIKEIGSIFSEKLGSGSNDFSSLTLDGFLCIKSYFLLENEADKKLQRYTVKPITKRMTGYSSYGTGTFSNFSLFGKKKEEPKEIHKIKVTSRPSELIGLANLWRIVIEATVSEVNEKASDLIIEIYQSIVTEDAEEKRQIVSEGVASCMSQIKKLTEDALEPSIKSDRLIRLLKLIESFISGSEENGTAGVKQQRALLKGELISNISITNSVAPGEARGRKYELSLYSNTTVFEIRNIVGVLIGLPAEFIKLTRFGNKGEIKDKDNGKTIGDLEFKNGESLVANKRNLDNIENAPLTNLDGSLTEDAEAIFHSWFDDFSPNGYMTRQDAVNFIRSCTDDKCTLKDQRIIKLFEYDADKDDKLTKEEFTEFYRNSSVRRPEIVRSNIIAHNYTNDLKKISEESIQNTDKTLLPRHIISHNEEHFDLLFSLLDANDESSEKAWKVI